MRESFVFYSSFVNALDKLPAEKQLELYQAITHYALYGEEPNIMDDISCAIFELIKPQIDANNKKYENGKKGAEFGKLGGRPKTPKETPKEPQENPLGVIDKNPKQTPNVNVNVNVNGNDNGNENGNENVFLLEKKSDPYINPIAEFYKKTYKEILGTNCYLSNEHRNKIIELASDIEDFKDTIPTVLKKLKDLKFDDINFKPSSTWLLKNDNYIKVLEGTFDKEHPLTAEEIKQKVMELRAAEGKGECIF